MLGFLIQGLVLSYGCLTLLCTRFLPLVSDTPSQMASSWLNFDAVQLLMETASPHKQTTYAAQASYV